MLRNSETLLREIDDVVSLLDWRHFLLSVIIVKEYSDHKYGRKYLVIRFKNI